MAAVLAPLLFPALGVTGATIAANVAIYAATTAASYFLQQALQPEQKDPGIRGEVAFGEDVPQSFIVGTYATAGSLVYANAYGGVGRTPNAYLVQVFCLSDLPVTGFASHLWVNNKRCNIDTGTTTSRGFPIPRFDRGGKSHMWVKFLDGTQTAADSYLIDKFGSHATHPWQTDMIGRGRALAIVTTRYDREQFSAFPAFLFVVDGVKLYDPRLDSTNGGSGSHRYGTASTYAWRDNAKVIAYNLARGIYYGSEWVYGGQNWPAWRLDNNSWFAAMNECDEAIALAAGGTEAQFEIGAEIRVNEKPVDVLDRIDAACLGRSAETGGIYKTYCGAGGSSIFSLTDDDLVASEPQSAGLFPGHEAWVNTIRASYIRPGQMWQIKALDARTDAAYVTADGGQTLEKAVAFDYITRGTQAQRIAQVMLRQGRRFISHVVAAPPWARKIEQFDVISWTSVKFGYSAKKFIVGEVNRSRNGVVIWTLTEEDPTDVAWSTGDEQTETDQVTDDLDASTDTIAITVTAVSIRNNAGTNKRPALKVTWTIDDDVADVVGVAFQVRDASTLDVVRRVRTDDWEDGEHIISGVGILKNQNYQVRAKWVPKSDRAVAWSAWTSVTAPNTGDDDDYTPSVPTGLTLTQRTSIDEDGKAHQKVVINWTADSNARTVYGIRISDGTDTWHMESDDNRARFDVRTNITYSVQVRGISPGGTKSALCSAVTITPVKDTVAPAAPTALTVTAKVKGLRLAWDECASDDYSKTRIWRHTTTTVGSATIVGRVSGTHFRDDENLTIGTTYYYWVSNVDRSGNESAKFGPVSGVYTGVSDADTDQTVLTAPGSPALSQASIDIDADGRADIAVVATWSAVTGAKNYELEITEAGTVIDYMMASGLKKTIKAKANKLYQIRIRGFSFNGTAGSWSGYGSITTAGKTAAPSTPTGLNIIQKPRGQVIRWDECTDRDYDETIIYRATSASFPGAGGKIGQVAGNRYLDQEDLALFPTVHYYWIQHRDRSGNLSSVAGPGTVYHRRVQNADIDDSQIDNPKLTTNAVQTTNVLTGNVTKRDQSSNYGGTTIGTTYTTIQSLTANHGTTAEGVVLLAQFLASTAGSYDVRIIDGPGNVVFQAVSFQARTDEWLMFHDNDANLSGSSTDYYLQARVASGSATVGYRKMTAISFKR